MIMDQMSERPAQFSFTFPCFSDHIYLNDDKNNQIIFFRPKRVSLIQNAITPCTVSQKERVQEISGHFRHIYDFIFDLICLLP